MVISGKELSAKLKSEMAEQVALFPVKYGRVPHLVVILVGCDVGSQTYVKNKAKACDLVGIKNTTIRLPEETTEKELLMGIKALIQAVWGLIRRYLLLQKKMRRLL